MESNLIIDFYLNSCNKSCSSGGYTLLCYQFENIKKETLNHFSKNEEKRIVNVCDRITRKHLEDLSKEIRLFDWKFCREDLLREKINISLQEF